MIKKIFSVKEHGAQVSVSLLIMRMIIGAAFMFHGWGKIQNPSGWLPEGGPMPIPAFFQVLAAISEFCGGAAMILGLLNPLANFGIGVTMLTAVYLHMIVRKDPFVSMTGGPSYELALVFLGFALTLILSGPGIFSLDRIIFGKRERSVKSEKTNGTGAV